ncbi:MAG: adenylate kinase [Actinomycetota bacterium]|nr:adenylate kinase [Actinomycetota bacterium]
MTRVVVIASASGSGKTTLGKELARRFEVPFHELDALYHGPGWTEATPEEFLARVEPLLAEGGWVVDGAYRSKLGDLVLGKADVVVWLDLPRRIWLPRLLRRTARRIVRREELWNGNRETVRSVLLSRDSLVLFALRTYPRNLRRYPTELAPYPTVRLRTPAAVARWLDDYSSSAISAAARAAPSVSTGR